MKKTQPIFRCLASAGLALSSVSSVLADAAAGKAIYDGKGVSWPHGQG